MDLLTTLAGFPNAAPLTGLDQAWTWSLGPVLHFAGAVTADGNRLLQTNQRGRHDEDLARAVLAFARQREQRLIGEGRPLAAVPGFSAAGYDFDAVAAVAPEVHCHHKTQNPDLTAVTYIVFPAFATEVCGRESLEEAQARYQKMLSPSEIGRDAVPFLKMSYDNPRTGGGSANDGRALAYPGRCARRSLSWRDRRADSSSGRTRSARCGGSRGTRVGCCAVVRRSSEGSAWTKYWTSPTPRCW